jgi:hypothetical protein
MKNNTKIPCVVVSLIITLSAVSCKNPRQHFVADWEKENPWSCSVDAYDSLESFTLSPDGATISFLGKKDGKWHFVVSDGWRPKVSEHARIEVDPSRDTGRTLALSPDSSRVGIVYSRASHWRDRAPHPEDDSGGQWFVMIDRHIFGGFDRDFKPTVHFSPDGSLFGFSYKKMGQYCVQIADTTFGPYERADVAFTRDGEIYLGYLKQGRAYIEMIKRQDDPVRVNPSR